MVDAETETNPPTPDSAEAATAESAAAEISAAAPKSNSAQAEDDGHGSAYWFWRHSAKGIAAFAQRHFWRFVFLAVFITLAFFVSRGYFHTSVIMLRKHLGAFIAGILILAFWCRRYRKARLQGRLILVVLALAGATAVYCWGSPVHSYFSLYYRYCTLKLVDLEELPQTDHERIQPLNSAFSLAHEKMADSEAPMLPHFVRIGDSFRFTIGIEPVYLLPRLFFGVKEVFSVNGTSATLDFSMENRKKVSFEVGENLLWGRNVYVAVCRAFGLWRYFNYEPDGLIYAVDDNGDWVQIIPLIHWKGIFFPWPEFGGVQLIRQSPNSIIDSCLRTVIGCGEWIRPEQIKEHQFLRQQNLLSYKVSRYMANSFRFHNGFLAPFPGYHKGDIRIPDMPIDVNDQPFTTYFRMSEVGGEDGLYHYFSLEPFNAEQQGLNTSLFVSADGSGNCYVYRHYARGSSLIGVTTIAAKVINERKQYDWNRNKPVEQRPYIKTINGQKRFFWLTTVVTFKDEGGKKFIGGNKPDVILTDAVTQATRWMDSLSPNAWVEQIGKDK